MEASHLTSSLSREDALARVRADGLVLNEMDASWKEDEEIVFAAALQNPAAVAHASLALRSNPSFIKRIFVKKPDVLLSVGEEFVNNRESMCTLVKCSRLALEYLGPTLKKDIHFFFRISQGRPWAFDYADPSLKSNRNFMLGMSREYPWLVNYASDGLLDIEFIKDALRLNSTVFMHLPDRFKSDRDVALFAVKRDSSNFEEIDPLLKNDRGIAFEAVRIKSALFAELPETLRADPAIALCAVAGDGLLLKDVLGIAAEMRDVVLTAIRQNGLALKFAHPSFRKDKWMVLDAIVKNYFAVKYALDEAANDIDVALAVVNRNGLLLEYLVNAHRDCEGVVKIAVAQNMKAFQYASERLRGDEAMVLLLLETYGLAIYPYLSDTTLGNVTIMQAIVKRDGMLLEYAKENVLLNKPTVMLAVKQNGLAIQFAKAFLGDKEVQMAALANNPAAAQSFL